MRGRHAWVAAGLLLAACSPGDTNYSVMKGDASPTTVAVTDSRGVSRIRTEDAAVVVRQGDAGVPFPIYAPRYPGAVVASSMQFETNLGLVGANIVLQTSDPAGRVIAFYKQAAATSGRKILMETITTQATMILVANATSGGPDVAITVAEAGDGTRTVAISQQMTTTDSASRRAARARVLSSRVQD